MVLAIALSTIVDRRAPGALLFGLEIGALIFGATTILTNGILLYRVHKGTGLTRDESRRLGATLWFGFGYAEWRRAIRRNKGGLSSRP
jgi:hypothetical protein